MAEPRRLSRQVFCSIEGDFDDEAQEELCAKLARYARSLGFDVSQDADIIARSVEQ